MKFNSLEPFLEYIQENHVNQANFWLDEMNSKNPSAATLLNYVRKYQLAATPSH